MEVVWRSCGGSVEVVWRPCGGSVETVWRPCGGSIEAVWRPCGGSVEAVWRQCGGSDKNFPSFGKATQNLNSSPLDQECDALTRLVNKCMSTHLNANVSLDSNANANVIFQEHMQMFWGRIQMQMFWFTHLQVHLN